jgi:Arc/MetJ family transcription regulator
VDEEASMRSQSTRRRRIPVDEDATAAAMRADGGGVNSRSAAATSAPKTATMEPQQHRDARDRAM